MGLGCSLAVMLAGCASKFAPDLTRRRPGSASLTDHQQESVDHQRSDPLQIGDRIEIDLNAGFRGVDSDSVVTRY